MLIEDIGSVVKRHAHNVALVVREADDVGVIAADRARLNANAPTHANRYTQVCVLCLSR